MDTDVGQSEFTPPGLISIVKVEKPFMSMLSFCDSWIWNFLGAAFGSQIRSFRNSFYFGEVTPESDIDFYMAILEECYEEFLIISAQDPHALLLINTMGWVEGRPFSVSFFIRTYMYCNLTDFGCDMLDDMVEAFDPGCILSIVHPESEIQYKVWFIIVIYL